MDEENTMPIDGEPQVHPYELAIRDHVPPPGYDVFETQSPGPLLRLPGRLHVGGRAWAFAYTVQTGGGVAGFRSRRQANHAAWSHFDQHGPGRMP
jgi:hypothetical protein